MYFYEKMSRILLKLPVDKQQEIIKNQEDYLKLWEEDNFLIDNEGNKKEKLGDDAINLKLEMALKEGLLKINLGIPVIFVINKSDIVTSNNERKKYEEDSEFIFKYITNRKFFKTNFKKHEREFENFGRNPSKTTRRNKCTNKNIPNNPLGRKW